MRALDASLALLLVLSIAPGRSGAQGGGGPSLTYCIGAGPGSCFCDCDEPSTAPCGNAGGTNCGCANGAFGTGANLDAAGQIDPDTVVLLAESCTPNQLGLFFQGSVTVNGGDGLPFGDGLRCTGGAVVRLEIVRVDARGGVHSSVRLSVAGGVRPGELLFYQLFYRDPVLSPCGLRFNSTNGYKIQW